MGSLDGRGSDGPRRTALPAQPGSKKSRGRAEIAQAVGARLDCLRCKPRRTRRTRVSRVEGRCAWFPGPVLSRTRSDPRDAGERIPRRVGPAFSICERESARPRRGVEERRRAGLHALRSCRDGAPRFRDDDAIGSRIELEVHRVLGVRAEGRGNPIPSILQDPARFDETFHVPLPSRGRMLFIFARKTEGGRLSQVYSTEPGEAIDPSLLR